MSSIDNFDSFLSSRNVDGASKLQRLRYHLAIEGCSDSQLSLAKSFLHDAAETDVERKENAELAVRWLLLASSEGNQEAFQLLENCYKMGVGVTYGNREHIETCLRSTSQEKLAQRVGCNLFRLIAYDTQESIPLEYFQKRISIYLKDEDITENHNLGLDSKVCSGTTYISAQDVVASIHDCLLGECPAIRIEDRPFEASGTDCKSNLSYGKCIIGEITKRCLLTCEVFCSKATDSHLCLISFSFVILILLAGTFIPTLYFVQYPEIFMQILECIVAYHSSVILIVSSARLVWYEKNLVNIRKWKKIICKCDNKLSGSIPKYSTFTFTTSFVIFFVGLILFKLNSYNFNSLALFGLCILFQFFYVKSSMNKMKIIPCVFLCFNFILALTRVSKGYDTAYTKGVTLLVIPVTSQEIVVKPAAIFSVLSFVVFLIIVCQNHVQSSLSFVLSTLWFHIITESICKIENFTSFIFVLFMIPAVKNLGIHGTILLVYLVDQFTTQTNCTVPIFVCVIYLLSLMLTKAIVFIKKNCFLSWYHVYPVLSFLVLLLCAHRLPFASILDFGTRTSITWSNYSKLCHRAAWMESNMVHTQLACEQFQYQNLYFEANVNNVVRKSFHHITFPRHLNFKLIDLNVSSYEIMLEIKGTFRVEATISLQTDDRCKDFVLDLSAGDLLSVVGTFESGVGTEKLVLMLEEATCISCMDDVKCHVKRLDFHPIRISKFAKVIEFIFYPWIQ